MVPELLDQGEFIKDWMDGTWSLIAQYRKGAEYRAGNNCCDNGDKEPRVGMEV
jgi:hypothetical protein